MISQTKGPAAPAPATPAPATPAPANPARGVPALRSLAALPRRLLAAFDHGIASLLFWQQIDHDIRRLAALGDGELDRLGLRRNQIVARVYEAARTREGRRR